MKQIEIRKKQGVKLVTGRGGKKFAVIKKRFVLYGPGTRTSDTKK